MIRRFCDLIPSGDAIPVEEVVGATVVVVKSEAGYTFRLRVNGLDYDLERDPLDGRLYLVRVKP